MINDFLFNFKWITVVKGLLYSSVPDFFKAMEEMNGKDLEGEKILKLFC